MTLATASDLLGSSASRIASPVKMSSINMIASVAKVNIPIQGACRLGFANESNRPNEGESVGKPKPRKSSAVKVGRGRALLAFEDG